MKTTSAAEAAAAAPVTEMAARDRKRRKAAPFICPSGMGLGLNRARCL